MFDQLAFISGDWVTDLIISSTIVFFIFFSVRVLIVTNDAKQFLKNILSLKSENKKDFIDTTKLDKRLLVWITDHLVYKVNGSEIQIETKGNLWLSKSPISQLIPSYDSNRHKMVPALLTSLGITGTFLGITLGLSQFSMAGDSKALLASAAELLEGMKTAFYTSLAGLSSSAIFMILIKLSSSSLARAQQSFLQTVSRQYFEASPIFYLKSMSNEGQQDVISAQLRSAEAMESMGASMKNSIDNLSQISRTFNGKAIAEQISVALEHSLETTMSPMMEAIKSELSSLKDIKEQSQRELMEMLVGEIEQKLIEPVTRELDKTTAAVLQSNKICMQLNSNVEQVVIATSETVSTINEFQKETMIKLQDFAESLRDILTSFKEDTRGAMSTIASEVKNMLTNASVGMDAQRQAFENSALNASAAFENIKDSLEATLVSRQSAEKQMFSDVTGRIESLLLQISTAFEDQAIIIHQTGETAANLLLQAQTNFEASVLKRRDEESALFISMETRISALVDNSQSVFKEQTNAIQQSGQSASNLLSKIQENFELSVQKRRDEEHHLFAKIQSRIEELVQRSQSVFKEQANSIKKISDDASDVMISAKIELQEGLGDIDTKVQSMSSTVQIELEAFRIQYQDNLTAYFEQQNNLLEGSLNKQRSGLNEVVENFRNVFESEYKARHNLLQELTAQYQQLEASAGTLERVAKAIGLNDAAKMAELQDAAHTMGREIALLKKEYASASKTFTDITENLPKAMDEYFTRANESFENFFSDFDQSASKIHNKLSQAAGYLINAQVQRREFEANEANL